MRPFKATANTLFQKYHKSHEHPNSRGSGQSFHNEPRSRETHIRQMDNDSVTSMKLKIDV
jgi:hypothetical protein